MRTRLRLRLLRDVEAVAGALLFALVPTLSAAGQSPIPQTLSLRDAVQIAIDRNPSIAEGRSLVGAAAADRTSAASRPNPALSIDSEGYPLFEANRPGFWSGQEFTVRFDQEFETSGRRRLRTQAAESAQQAAEFALRDRMRLLELDVRRAYLAAVLAEADHTVAQAALDAIDRVITLNRERLKQGEIAGTELRRLQVERLRFVEDLFAAQLAAKNARSALLAFLNAPALDQPLTLTDELATANTALAPVLALTTAAADAGSLATQALGSRPDLLSSRRVIAQTETVTRLQRALRTPNVTFGGGYRSSMGSKGIVFGGTIPLPLFNRNQGGVARADAERLAAQARATAVETTIRLEVQRAANAVQTNRERVTYIEREHLANAQQSRDAVLESYRLGAVDLIDFLDAQRAFRDTQRTYNRALFDHRLSLFELAAAIGLTDVPPGGHNR